MTPCQKIKREILMEFVASCKDAISRGIKISDEDEKLLTLTAPGITEDVIDEQYRALCGGYDYCDLANEFRSGECETRIPCEFSRNYESKSVAAKMCDGSWIGWTYFYGGGKHGEPEAVEWMEYAYELDVVETEKMVVVREFKRRET